MFLFVLNKRYFFVSFKGWGYDELTDTANNKLFELNFGGGTPIGCGDCGIVTTNQFSFSG